MFIVVYVISYKGEPLMPCSSPIARLLLKEGKAKCIRRTPFTIKLLYKTATKYTQKLTLGIDTGSSYIGSAVADQNNNIIYMSQIEIRNDITKKMERRANYRKHRRNRKTRYRKARWTNRKNSIKKDRFSPTITSKINSHLKEIKFVNSILPISNTIIEAGNFDPHALKNPAVLRNKWLYQKGINYGYANTKAYVLDRDSYKCQYCKGKNKDSRLEVHHIIFRSKDGSNEQENLLTLCKTCHDDLHKEKIKLSLKGKQKGSLRHATQMNSIRTQLLRRLPEAIETFGFITKEHRQLAGLSKEHYNDAVIIACQSDKVQFKTGIILFKKCVSAGDYRQTRGIRSQQRLPTGKIQGFRKFDKVKYLGTEYFIKARMSNYGYAFLMDIHNKNIKLKPMAKLEKMIRISARKSWMIAENKLVS